YRIGRSGEPKLGGPTLLGNPDFHGLGPSFPCKRDLCGRLFIVLPGHRLELIVGSSKLAVRAVDRPSTIA
ncbi:MAG: hypothetical protein AAF637_09980, partial [Pseudomonadota bacterium]